MRKRKNAYRALVSNPERKTSLGRTRLRWKYDVKMDFNKWGGRRGLH